MENTIYLKNVVVNIPSFDQLWNALPEEVRKDMAKEYADQDDKLMDTYYKLVNATRDTEEAKAACSEMGSVLSELNSNMGNVYRAYNKLREVYHDELLSCFGWAVGHEEVSISMSTWRKAGEQYICEFTVNDLSKPVGDSYNWHGQNTSRWITAGAIVVDNYGGKWKISTHH